MKKNLYNLYISIYLLNYIYENDRIISFMRVKIIGNKT